MFIIDDIINAITQGVTTKQQIDAQKEAAEMQLQAQREQNEFQREANRQQQLFASRQADLAWQRDKEATNLAFERNNSLGQLKQLVAAGLSEQQARQIIAGAGATGEMGVSTYTPPEAINQMQGVDVAAEGAIQADALREQAATHARGMQQVGASIANMAADAAKMLFDSFASEDGGVMGTWTAHKALNFVTKNIHTIDKNKVHSFADLGSWVHSLDPESSVGKIWQPFIQSPEYQRMENFAPAIRSFNSFLGKLYTDNLTMGERIDKIASDIDFNYANSIMTQVASSEKAEHIKYLQSLEGKTAEEIALIQEQTKVEQQAGNLIIQQVIGQKRANRLLLNEANRSDELYDVITSADRASFMAKFEKATADASLWSNDEYVKTWIDRNLADEKSKLQLELLMSLRNQQSYDLLSKHPTYYRFCEMFDALDKCGVLQHIEKFVELTEEGVRIRNNKEVGMAHAKKGKNPIEDLDVKDAIKIAKVASAVIK